MDGGSFTSDEVNFLVYRYLLENGFQHTAFTFGCESNIVNSTIDGTLVPRGALISIIQKGLHFTEAEFFAALASTASDPNDARIYEGCLGTTGLLEAVLPDAERIKILEKKIIDELGQDACARLPPNLRIVEPPQPTSGDLSASSSRTSSDVESLDGMEEDNDENNEQGASTSNTLLNTNLKEEPQFDSRPPNSILSHTNTGQFPNSSGPDSNIYMNATSSGNESNGMALNPAQYAADATNRQTATVLPNVHNSYSPGRVFSNGSNNSPNTFAGHSGKMKASAALAATRPGLNGTNMVDGNGSVQLVHRNGKTLPNIPDLNPDLELDRNNVIMLKGHTSDVFICSFNPRIDLIASGSGDGTARVWHAPESFAPYGPSQIESGCLVLNHRNPGQMEDSQADVTSIDWALSGNFLVTGCYTGEARVWSREGALLYTNHSHQGPIFALKWNQSANRVLSAGGDNSTIVWDPKSSKTDKFSFHSSSALDVDWITDDVFASCSVDRCIHICKLGMNTPWKTFYGHENEVNAVKYDKVSHRLASCSDDRTLKIWSLDEDKPVFDFKAHDKEIYTIRWSPTNSLIASASFDQSIKVWNAERGECTYRLMKHTEPVYTVAFSPDNRLLASGSIDQTVNLWDLNTGKVVMTYTGSCSGIFEVDWNQRGDRIAAATGNGTVLLFDVRFLKDSLR